MRRSATLVLTLVVFFALTSLAFAGPHDGGEGWYGETDDKAVTNFGFYLIMFFPLFIFLMSMLQMVLDRRKDARKKAEKARKARADLRGGW